MAKFELPEIDVVMFSETVIYTDSTAGYEDSKNEVVHQYSYNAIGGADGDFPL